MDLGDRSLSIATILPSGSRPHQRHYRMAAMRGWHGSGPGAAPPAGQAMQFPCQVGAGPCSLFVRVHPLFRGWAWCYPLTTMCVWVGWYLPGWVGMGRTWCTPLGIGVTDGTLPSREFTKGPGRRCASTPLDTPARVGYVLRTTKPNARRTSWNHDGQNRPRNCTASLNGT